MNNILNYAVVRKIKVEITVKFLILVAINNLKFSYSKKIPQDIGMKKIFLPLMLLTILATNCSQPKKQEIPMLNKRDFEQTVNGKKVELYVLKNSSGMVSEITNYGARVVTLWVPDKDGDFDDVVLGYENIEGYLNSNDIYYGATIGRYANRIGKGKFSLGGEEYTLATNNGENHLHGGNDGFNNVVWDARQIDNQKLELTYLSKDGEEGYPGNMQVRMVYQLTDDNELKVEYWATTDKTTLANFTHHSYFNLHGAGNGTINDHLVQINADKYTPVDATLIPTGVLEPVDNTPMDFREPVAVGQRIGDDFEQLKIGVGYDHNYVLNQSTQGLNFAARVVGPKTGRVMEVLTNEPGMQFYSGNFMNGSDTGKQNKVYKYREALCFETQHFPDTPNKANFPDAVLNPGEEYYSVCSYKFSVED